MNNPYNSNQGLNPPQPMYFNNNLQPQPQNPIYINNNAPVPANNQGNPYQGQQLNDMGSARPIIVNVNGPQGVGAGVCPLCHTNVGTIQRGERGGVYCLVFWLILCFFWPLFCCIDIDDYKDRRLECANCHGTRHFRKA